MGSFRDASARSIPLVITVIASFSCTGETKREAEPTPEPRIIDASDPMDSGQAPTPDAGEPDAEPPPVVDPPPVQQTCGNGIVEGTEVCDDGNPSDSDYCVGCSQAFYCGDGIVQPTHEDCDDGSSICVNCELAQSSGVADLSSEMGTLSPEQLAGFCEWVNATMAQISLPVTCVTTTLTTIEKADCTTDTPVAPLHPGLQIRTWAGCNATLGTIEECYAAIAGFPCYILVPELVPACSPDACAYHAVGEPCEIPADCASGNCCADADAGTMACCNDSLP